MGRAPFRGAESFIVTGTVACGLGARGAAAGWVRDRVDGDGDVLCLGGGVKACAEPELPSKGMQATSPVS